MEAIVVPVSGGGLLSGVCIAVKNMKPHVKVFAAEPLNADDCAKSFAAKKLIPLQGLCSVQYLQSLRLFHLSDNFD